MTHDEIIRMAREAGLYHFYDSEGDLTGITDAKPIDEDKNRNDDRLVEILGPLIALVRAAERERIKAANAPEIERINEHIKTLEKTVADERIVDDLCLLHLGWKAGADGDIYRDLYRAAMDRVVARAIRARGSKP